MYKVIIAGLLLVGLTACCVTPPEPPPVEKQKVRVYQNNDTAEFQLCDTEQGNPYSYTFIGVVILPEGNADRCSFYQDESVPPAEPKK